MYFSYDGNEIPVKIIRKNNKNIYFRFKEDYLEVTANSFVSERKIKSLLEENYNSLAKMYQKTLKKEKHKEVFTLLGKPYTIIYDASYKDVVIDDNFIFVKNEVMLNKFIKNETKRIFTEEVNRIKKYFSNIPTFSLRIRKMTTRWGVCNRTDNIVTLNSELIYQDISHLDYVIVHELCHFYHGNHSKDFWDKVSIYYPEYKKIRKEMREY